ncbi:DUF370 domain-containing protein [Clostridium pasteurianum]|uniref:DUF370 domain-containing protein n=1 Tax=Clostridium pasteurianum BC1 TaxID=86416 RepID=R4KCY9_CLOPA|nr:DUF370 domain-containing protein [Clostridium pasteurianum]AGK97485.1 hypothetical protein Clopa_2628 [Clostridium pasteurianum BC1]
MSKFLNIGSDNYISVNKVVVITQPSSAPIKRIIQKTKGNELIDCTKGRKMLSVIFTKDNKVILSPVNKQTLNKRLECLKNKL